MENGSPETPDYIKACRCFIKMVEHERSGVKMWLSDRKAVHEEVLKESQIKDKLFPVN